ncbi:MAG: UDP-N-acetylglucosamine 2-epimerase (non-hydrolyzing) [Candidatus Kapabacteria bacterium]|nr:UDP-N-acetylglucosamine 2-epimerase (non-hydrolyzing) [Candidatus Kapabacteria bacterium]MCS7169333.1 UDP-N-acetylglucosamine 2-epimerase (non-hydrolyzing) [Candidatus Kapabacteria bacterium]MDW7996923.1 UDP-N-acetylglucosamine 2-epimerase (non-hydrolyzing) [Bacteroidota bacterium]MDW8224818.1 UDP-N-acetylglucosamine 2-epimerase (non-hydrolyzing) [Bacteroidota bacterium]
MRARLLSVVGARPNYMKVAPLHRAFARYAERVEHIIVHTGQHYDAELSDVFFADLEMPEPAVFLGVGSGTQAQQTARIMLAFEPVCLQLRPQLVFVVGDVNSTIACALTAVKLGIPVAHVEAGLRSFDRRMPEEINRVATDAIADYFFVTEPSGVENLRREGKSEEQIFLVGNTMIDSLLFALPKARCHSIRSDLGLQPRGYVVVTLHRPSNVDNPEQLRLLLQLFSELAQWRTVVFPVHPRTRQAIDRFGLEQYVRPLCLLPPLRYVEFLALVLESDFVVTDSGGIQEETTYLGIPCLTLRTTTERPITCQLGTNWLVPPEPGPLRAALQTLQRGERKQGQVPPLWDGHAAERIAQIVLERCLRISVE